MPETIEQNTRGPMTAAGRGKKARSWHGGQFPYSVILLCMLPGILHYLVFRLIPSGATAFLSFTNISGLPNAAWKWIGFDNYREFFVLQNVRDLKNTLARTGVFAVSVTLIQNALALLVAIVVSQKFLRGRSLFRAVYFMPVILGTAVVATIWKLLFSTPTGPVFLFMQSVLGIEAPPAVLSSYTYAFPAVIAAQIWQNMGYSMVIFIAGLQSIAQELYEAANIDGAGKWQSFRRITFPLIWPALTVNALLSIIGSLQSFELIMTITRGSFNTATLGMRVFATAFGGTGATASGAAVAGMRQGYAAAQSMVLFVVVLVVTIISQILMRKAEVEQ
ncbi:MAG: sugar ABC transporter permease [Clostridiales bacterium]|jgi:raffinose/stachyose/melibiose transport system permease protein|nr:sugar ABC transporter permease [Clostridiales bacterium]